MGSMVTVKLPGNITEGDRYLFDPYLMYPLEELKVLQLQKVFVTYSGLCVDENGLIAESHHRYPEKHQQLLNEVAFFLNKSSSDENNLLELDNENTYLLIHHPWSSNYWHWMSEAILRLWMVREKVNEMVLILPEHFRNLEFISGSLLPFQIKNTFYIPFNKSLLIRNLCLPQIKPIADSYYAGDIQTIRKFYLTSYVTEKNPRFNLGDKVYISRKKSSKRKVKNEEEVEQLLTKYGFACISNEDYNFGEQINVFSYARYLISIHGAGLTNMLFMKENSSILELHKKQTNTTDWHSFAFWYLADALYFKYYHQVCDPENPEAHFFEADYIIDTQLLEKNLIQMLA